MSPTESDTGGVTPARDAVMRRIATQVKRFPDLSLGPIEVEGPSARDRALAQAIYSETLRRWITLEAMVQLRLDRPLDRLEPKMQAALMVGAAQLFFFDHLPDHAVVNETVEWAGRRIRRQARGMANAVLRRLIDLRGEVVAADQAKGVDPRRVLPLSDGRHRLLTTNGLPDAPLDRLATQTSHPRELVERWASRMGRPELERLLAHNLVMPPTIVTGLAPSDVDGRADLAAHDEPGFYIWNGDHASLLELLHDHPGARVQDPASAAVVDDLATTDLDLDGAIIVDLCAGLGTKTGQLAATFPAARMIASDASGDRLDALVRAFGDHPQVTVTPPSGLLQYAGRADLVLVDVPCSNTGVLARRIEAKYRTDTSHLRRLVDIQRQILVESVRLRGTRGVIVYSTCSLEPEENEAQTEWLKRWHDLRLIRARSRQPVGAPGESPVRYRDGGYHAVLG